MGLGGRLDATNVVESDVAMITSIALDHCDWLGDTREAVAVEKAGVYRASKPAISVRDGNGAVLARWEVAPTHGMGIDTLGNIYVGLTKLGRIDKYVKV